MRIKQGMSEEMFVKILKLQEEGTPWKEIIKRFPEAATEVREIQATIQMLERSRKDVAPSTHLLQKILKNIPPAQSVPEGSPFSRVVSAFLKFGAPLAVAAAVFLLIFTLNTPTAPVGNFDQLALKNTEDSSLPAQTEQTPSLMTAPQQSSQTGPAGAAPSTESATADRAADQALASSYNDGSSADPAMQSYFDPAAINAYDQSANSTPL